MGTYGRLCPVTPKVYHEASPTSLWYSNHISLKWNKLFKRTIWRWICSTIAESAAKVTSASTDYESGLSRRNAVAVDEAKYAGRSVSRNEMMIEDEEFPDEQFELDPDLYEICDEDPEDDGSDG